MIGEHLVPALVGACVFAVPTALILVCNRGSRKRQARGLLRLIVFGFVGLLISVFYQLLQ